MRYEEVYRKIIDLEFDKEEIIYIEDNLEIYLFRPSKTSRNFKNYDKNKNFQIWLKEGERKFRPNHLRILIDLNLRVRCRPDLKEKLLIAFDNIFYKKDPIESLKKLQEEKFEYYLNSLNVIGILAQLFIIEQDYGYTSNRESNYEPPTLFLQGWIREFIDNPKEIDNLCMSVCKGHPPAATYTNYENKKSKKFKDNLDILWYIR